MRNIDENGRLIEKEKPKTIQVDRSTQKAWLDSLGEMYLQHLENPDDSGIFNAYSGELQSYNSSFASPPPLPSTIQDMDYQAQITLENEAAQQHARENPHDLNSQYYARAKLEQKMTNVPGVMEDIPGNHVAKAFEGDNSEPYIEICGGGDEADPIEICG